MNTCPRAGETARNTSEGYRPLPPARGWLFLEIAKRFLCLGFFFAKVVKTAQTAFSD